MPVGCSGTSKPKAPETVAEVPPTTVAPVEAGWDAQFVGASPWLTTRDDATSYINGANFFVFRCDFTGAPAGAVTLVIRANIEGNPQLRVSTDSGFVIRHTVTLADQLAQSTWSEGTVTTPLTIAGGTVSLWIRTTGTGTWRQSLTYLALFGGDGRTPPLRLMNRDDINGAAGGPQLRLVPRASSRRAWHRPFGYL